MFSIQRLFLERVTAHLSELKLILDTDWPRFRARVLNAASGQMDSSKIFDAIVKAEPRGPAADFIKDLLRESWIEDQKAGINASAGDQQLSAIAAQILVERLLSDAAIESEFGSVESDYEYASELSPQSPQSAPGTDGSGSDVHESAVEPTPKSPRRGPGSLRIGPVEYERPSEPAPTSPRSWTGVRSGRPPDVHESASEPSQNREITVTGHSIDGAPVSEFHEGETYRLFFRVGIPVSENLASGDTRVTDVPSGGLATHWVVTSRDVEFIPALSTATVQKIGSTWLAEFDLLIPETGNSQTEAVAILAGAQPGNLLVSIYSVSSGGRREVYREVSISLADRLSVKADETFKAPMHTHLRTTHEWTTPPEHVQVSIRNSVAEISTIRIRLENYQFVEPFTATDTHISTAIDNVRKALEEFREAHGTYLDDLDAADIAAKLAAPGNWQPNFFKPNGWQPLPDGSDAGRKAAFDQVQQSDEWRALAHAGYALFDRCFPQASKLRPLLNKLLPGSRIDFHWSEQSGPGWVSHVPWALMYTEPVGISGTTPPEPEKFLGLRFRVGTRSWNVSNGSVALGELGKTNSMHLLYWGDKPGDDVAAEAQWQAGEYRKRTWSKLVPDTTKPDLKRQVLVALDAPEPSPVGLLYFYCHCSVGNGSKTVLRFGNTSKRDDIVEERDFPQSSIPSGPIIFANACTTAQADANRTSELEQSFFGRGARAFIGTETKVPIKLASKFAWLYFQFFYRIVDPEPMAAGEALTQARMFLWTQYRNVGGLFYSMTNQYDLYLASDQEVIALRH